MSDARIQPDAELADLAAAHAAGSLTPEQAAHLERRCAADPAAMRTFLAYLDLEAELSFARLAESTAPAPAIPTYRKGHAPNPKSETRIPKLAIAFSIAAALLAACGLAAYFFAFNADPSDIEHRPSHIEHPPLATLIEATGKLTTPDGYTSEGREYAAGEYALSGNASDHAQLVLTNRVTVELRGETRLTLHNNMRATLTEGSARFNCPRGAEGFAVALPGGARVVDLGTRFGIDLDDDGHARIQVIEGAIEVRTADGLAAGIEPGTPLRLVDGGTIEWIDREDVAIANASFEQPALASAPYRHGATGWDSLDADEQHGVNGFGPQFTDPVPNGDQLAFLNTGAIAQTTDALLMPNQRYTLTVAVGNRPGGNSPDYTLELHTGEQLLASAVNPAKPAKGRFADAQLVFDCPPDHPALGEPLRIVLRSNGSLSTRTQNHFDNVRLRVESIKNFAQPNPQSADKPRLEGDPS